MLLASIGIFMQSGGYPNLFKNPIEITDWLVTGWLLYDSRPIIQCDTILQYISVYQYQTYALMIYRFLSLLTHSPTYTFTHQLSAIHQLTPTPTYSAIHQLTHTNSHLLSDSPTHTHQLSLTQPLTNSHTPNLTYSVTH